MDIVVASDSFAPKIDGVSTTSGIVARMLAARGHRVRVIAPAPGRTRMDGNEVARLPSIPCPLYPELRLTLPMTSERLIRRNPPDAAIVFTPGPIGMGVARAMSPRTRLLHVYTTDMPAYFRAYGVSSLYGPFERLMRQISERAAATLCPTERVRRNLARRDYPRLQIWGRGVDLSLFNPERRSAEMRRRLAGGEPEKPLILYVGRLAREKRLLDLYEAAQRLHGIRIALVGDGPQRDMLERQFSALPTVFTGYLRGESLAQAFASADIFVFPSDTDTFGQVALQAMASGVPPIVVAGSAAAEFVPRDSVGLHVRGRDPEALAAAIASLALAPDRRSAMGEAAAAWSRRFSWDALLDQLETTLHGGSVLESKVMGV